ncbi:glycosyltransferase family 2 protein [Aeromonas sp. 96A]|uniref:glycosyltransferase family 2 protein n=1 Tax=Aeromonas sp. 96A TaxID=3452730 RepID=UPI003F7A6FF6
MKPASYKLSIAIPTYNRASILDRALENIARQISSADDIQVVISDNGSTDHTRSIVEKYISILNIKYVCLPSNQGFDRNFINAICESDGEYVWVKGDDDLIAPSMINAAKHIIDNNYDVAILNGGDYKSGTLVPRLRIEPDFSSFDSLFSSIGWHLTWIGTVIIRKSILKIDELTSYEYNNFVHMPLYINSINHEHLISFSRDIFIHTTVNNSEYFSTPEKLVSLFGGCLYNSIERYIGVKLSKSTVSSIISGFRINIGMFTFKYFLMSRIVNDYSFRRHYILLNSYCRLNKWASIWLLSFIFPNVLMVKAYHKYKKFRES